MTLTIRDIRTHTVNIMLEAPYCWVQGTLDGFTQTIIEVVTEEGLIGLGEAPGAGSAGVIANNYLPRLKGRDALDIQGCEQVCLPAWRGAHSNNDYASIRAFGGVEMALWDLRGKLWDQPLYTLLGGAFRKRIPFADYFAFRMECDGKGGESTPEEVADYCLALKENHGSYIFEGKMSNRDPKKGLALVRCLREALGDEAVLRVDSNRAYSLAAALRLAPALEELSVANWEDPVCTFEEMARLRMKCAIPFSTHNIDIPRALDLGAPDAFVTDVSVHGGLGRMKNFIAACEAVGLDFWPYSGDSGVGMAAYLHICAASPWVHHPGQSLLRMQKGDVIKGGPFLTHGSLVAVPEGPGLGVELDPEGLPEAKRHFADNGPLNKFHDPASPGVYRRMPLA